MIFKIIFVGFLIFLFGAVFYRSFKSMFAPVKTVDAVVVKKYKVASKSAAIRRYYYYRKDKVFFQVKYSLSLYVV